MNIYENEMSDEELDNVVGGAVKQSPVGEANSEKKVVFLYNIGQSVNQIALWGTVKVKIVDREVRKRGSKYYPYYQVGSGLELEWIPQSNIAK